MAFPDSVVEDCWRIAYGNCERCRKDLAWDNRGMMGEGAWEAHHTDGNTDNNALTNCKILCWPCHEQTLGLD